MKSKERELGSYVDQKTLFTGTDFRNKIRDLSHEDIAECYQCGLCSARCIMASETDMLVRMVIRLAQLERTEILESKAIWLCLSCSSCRIRCPKDIDLRKVMETLKQMSAGKGVVKYAVNCRQCGRLFSSTPILDYIRKRTENLLEDRSIDLCPTCRARTRFLSLSIDERHSEKERF